MYCPNCASQNKDDGKFCRTCGANLSLVPQALTGELPERRRRSHRMERRQARSADLSHVIGKAFTGVSFLLIALILCLFRQYWGVWMLIPGFAGLGKGVAEIIAARQAIAGPARVAVPSAPPAPNTGPLGVDNPREIIAPSASVTEGTRKLFDEADSSRH